MVRILGCDAVFLQQIAAGFFWQPVACIRGASLLFAEGKLLFAHDKRHNASYFHEPPGFVWTPVQSHGQPTVAVGWMLLVGCLELGTVLLVALLEQYCLAVAGSAGHSKPTSEVFNPAWCDLAKQGYFFGRFISAVALPSRA